MLKPCRAEIPQNALQYLAIWSMRDDYRKFNALPPSVRKQHKKVYAIVYEAHRQAACRFYEECPNYWYDDRETGQKEIDIGLSLACYYGHEPMVDFFRYLGGSFRYCHYLPFHKACETGRFGLVKQIYEEICRDFDVENTINCGLAVSSGNGQFRLVEWFLSKGADLHNNIDAAFRGACKYNHLAVAKLLFAHGADIHEVEDDPFKDSYACDHIEILAFLIGADPNYDWDAIQV